MALVTLIIIVIIVIIIVAVIIVVITVVVGVVVVLLHILPLLYMQGKFDPTKLQRPMLALDGYCQVIVQLPTNIRNRTKPR
jgi:fatty acid desaturase